jgi:tryptophan synthase alpha chain
MSRIAARFARLAAEGRGALIPYLQAYDPDAATSLALLRGMPGAGADLIEIGVPFTDPMADGPSIQAAALRGLAAGSTVVRVLAMVTEFRKEDAETPIILMGYLNPVLTHGFDAFARDAAEAGADGLIIVDCPPEEADPLADALDVTGVALIRLATPTSDDARLRVVVRRTSGFVYYVSVAGVTGVKEADAAVVAPAVARVRRASGLPVAVGFGIKTAERAAAVARIADAVVVGSALVDEVAKGLETGGVTARVLDTASALAQAVHSARVTQGYVQA